MPLIGLVCPNDVLVTFDRCLNDCTNRCTPYPIAHSIILDNIDNEHVGDMISATSMIGCMRKTYLERTNDYYDSFSNLWYSSRGVWMHSALEALEGDIRWELESRYSLDIDGFRISGRIDAYDKINHHLYDYKTSKDKNVEYIEKNGPKEDHIMQVSIYKYILDNNNIPVDKVTIIYMSMSTICTCNDVFTYPRHVVIDFLSKNGAVLNRAFKNGKIPPIPDPQPIWLCNSFCPVKEVCDGCRS
jgi:hypothetical protein